MKISELLEWGRIVKGVNTTVDVGPDEIKTQAAKFGNSVDKDGRPPTLSKKVKGKSTNVLYNLGLAEEKDHIPYQDLVAQAINDKKMTFINPNTGKEQSVMNPKHVGNRQKELAFKYIYDYPMTSQERAELRPWVNIPGDKNLMKMPVTQMTVDQAVRWDMLGHPDMPQATIDAARERYPDDEKVKNPTTYKLKSEGVEEEWSAKYKRSINCSSPKGFSQKAHCAGRKKESIGEGEFRASDVEEFKPDNDALNDLKSKYLPDWEMLDHRILQAKYVADDHRAAVAFVKIINMLSEKMDHFCEVTQDVAEVTVKTTTFDVKGLTILDFQIAMVIDKFASDVGIKQVPMSGNFGMHEDIELDEGIIDSILDFLKPYIEKGQAKLRKLREAIKREWWETGLMWEIIQKGTKAKDHEIKFANEQFKDMLKAVGLGSWLALPIPGNTLWITLLEKLLNKFDISIMPDSVKQVGVFDSMNENSSSCPRTKATKCQCESVNKLSESQETITAVCVLEHSDEVKGTLLFKQEANGPTLIVGKITGLEPGEHGFHIHEFGDLSNGCESAGGHYDPDGVNHGDVKEGHVGDLGNITADKNGVANISIAAERVDLTGDRSVVGRAVVVHSDEDDLGKGGDDESLKTGNAGDRLACGVITLKENVNENFADGKVKGKSRPGRVKRAGASCKGSVTKLRKQAKNASGEKAKMYHWCANMKSGKKK